MKTKLTKFFVSSVAHYWDSGPDRSWTPIPALLPAKHARTTILFILSQKIYYVAPSLDPIFPATDEAPPLPSSPNRTWYHNLAGPGTVMACEDHTLWRDPRDPRSDWSPITDFLEHYPSDSQISAGQNLLWFGLRSSCIWQAMSARGGSALDAQARISGMMSLPLDPQQWRVEAETLFQTSLARIQVEIHNIARGAGANRPGMVKLQTWTPICDDTYNFNADGWINVNTIGSLIVMIPSALIVILALPTSDEKLWLDRLIESHIVYKGYTYAKRGWTRVKILWRSVGERINDSCRRRWAVLKLNWRRDTWKRRGTKVADFFRGCYGSSIQE